MKILEVGMGPCLGGIEVYFHNYYKKLSSDFHFDFTDRDGGLYFSEEYKANGSTIHHMPDFNRHPVKYFFTLKKIIKDGNYDAVHINMLSLANILPVLAAQFTKVKVIIHSHNAGMPSGLARKVLHFINKPFVALADNRLACSEAAGKWMFGKKSFTVIPNAIDLSVFSLNEEKRNEIRQKYNIGDSVLIGHVGRFAEQKNHAFLIDVFAELCRKSAKYKLMLVGEGELMEEIKQKVADAGLKDKVIFTGSVSNVQDYMQAMDVFVLPSLFEGLPVTGIEAQASSLPCVFSDRITKELKITDNVVFVPIEDKTAWIKEIEQLTSTPRIDNTAKLKESGYDIKNSIKLLETKLMKF